MTNGSDEMAWSPMQFAAQLQEAGQEMTAQQMQAFTELMSTGTDSPSGLDPTGLASLGTGMAMFKTRVQSGGRISIPRYRTRGVGYRRRRHRPDVRHSNQAALQ